MNFRKIKFSGIGVLTRLPGFQPRPFFVFLDVAEPLFKEAYQQLF